MSVKRWNGTSWEIYAGADSSGSAATLIVAKGDLLAGVAAGSIARLAVGANNTVLIADSTATSGVKWGAVNDATKVALSTITAKGDLILGTGSGAVARQGVGTDGQILMADSTQTNGVKWSAASYVAQSNGTVTFASTSSGVVRNIYVNTTDPTGGADGDVWLKYV